MKLAYQDFKFRNDTLRTIQYINQIIDTYQKQGFVLSVRQLYYQLVARDYVPNTIQSYKRIAQYVNDGRLAGLIDWNAIEDRNRDVVKRSAWASGAQILKGAARSFHMDLWEGQESRIFVVVEKAALSGVLDSVCHQYDVPLLAARGYPSVSILRDMSLGHIVTALNEGQNVTVLHLGDHDPSGIDMTRDLTERYSLFVNRHYDGNRHFQVKRIALNMDQVEEKNPPPNPAKTTDSRFDDYRKQFGSDSWELDALEPSYLQSLVRAEVETLIDYSVWDERRDDIEDQRKRLYTIANTWE